jgi:hypothetical protein
MEELIRADRRITIDSVATALGRSYGFAYSKMHDRLKFRKENGRIEKKMNRMDLSLQRLLRYADEGEDTLNKIVNGDESWVRRYQPESKHASI